MSECLSSRVRRVVVGVLVCLSSPVFGQDLPGSADHPMFPTRMPGYRITLFQQTDFDKYEFREARGTTVVEGRRTRIHYQIPAGQPLPGL